MRHGKGMMRYASGDVYIGHWKFGLRDGEGKLECQKYFHMARVHLFPNDCESFLDDDCEEFARAQKRRYLP